MPLALKHPLCDHRQPAGVGDWCAAVSKATGTVRVGRVASVDADGTVWGIYLHGSVRIVVDDQRFVEHGTAFSDAAQGEYPNVDAAAAVLQQYRK